ncbi:STAS domain-containing protein [Kitasatospora sp. NPDC048194]|uniref:STAS domain-containing protein n=1 Tax=Kitasatospora sp. NPDC048194 TaxID=3364045 RepID=UPI0037249BA9
MRTTPGEAVLTCDLGALTAPDLAVVDALARLRSAAARHGVGVVLVNADGPLRELLAFAGLSALLPGAADPLDSAGLADLPDLADLADRPGLADLPGLAEPAGRSGLLGVETGREAEQGEEHVRVQEVGDSGDPAL